VYRWESGPALVQPSIFHADRDDPYIYGEIAAATPSAISMRWADARSPRSRFAAFPQRWARARNDPRYLQGGFRQVARSGRLAARRTHSADQEIKFGYANHWRHRSDPHAGERGAKAGDVLFLTKAARHCIVGTAIKFDRVDASLAEEAVRSMRTLNRAAAEQSRRCRQATFTRAPT